MSVFYKPEGPAGEYAELGLNLYNTCPHGCKYCYVPGTLRKTRAEYFQPAKRMKWELENLERDAGKLDPSTTPAINLCFVGDPYPVEFEGDDVTREAIGILKSGSLLGALKVQILTKGGTRACRDYDLLTQEDRVGATLTFIDQADSLEWEPRAALPEDRLQGLMEAHVQGIGTWASLEPVIDTEQTLALIERAAPFVDFFWVGKLNHYKAEPVDWNRFCQKVKELMDNLGADYSFKESLKPYDEEVTSL